MGAIRENQETLIEAIDPDSLSGVRFRVSRELMDFRQWAEKHPKASLRRFSIADVGEMAPPTISSSKLEQMAQPIEVVVAYPKASALYGKQGSPDCRDIMREDRVDICSAIGIRGFANHLAGQNDCIDIDTEIEEGDAVWFLVNRFTVHFARAPYLPDAPLPPVPSDTASGIYFPETAADFLRLGIGAPSHLYLCQESSGDIIDQIGGVDLVNAGTGTYQHAMDSLTRVGVRTQSNFYGTIDQVSATESLAMLIVSDMAPASSLVEGTLAAIGDRFEFEVFCTFGTGTANGQAKAWVQNNAYGTVGAINPPAGSDGITNVALLIMNRATAKCWLLTDTATIELNAAPLAQAVAGTQIAIGESFSPSTGCKTPCAYFAVWRGPVAETLGRATLDALGWPSP